MNTERLNPRLLLDAPLSEQVARWRLTVGLTAAERKLLLGLVDLLLINGSLMAIAAISYGFRLSTESLAVNAKWFITLSVLWWIFGSVLDVYNLARSASVTSIVSSAGLAALLTTITYVLTPFVTPAIEARSYVFSLVVIATAMILAWRTFYARALSQPAFERRVLIVGTNVMARSLADSLNRASQVGSANPFRGTGYHVMGLLSEEPVVPSDEHSDLPVLGGVGEIVKIARLCRADEIVVALDDQHLQDPQVHEVLLDCGELGWRISSSADVYERLSARVPVEYAVGDLRILLGRDDGPAHRLYLAIKLLGDYTLAALGLIPLGLLIPWIALANALWSPGPLFYEQERVGKGGRPFRLVKFRSMRVDAEKLQGAVWSSNGDPRITPVGRWLRKTRLDEVPQVINVLRGEMSVVGPRPERPYFVGHLAQQLPLYRARHGAKPGITGWAQTHYRYGNTVEDSRIKLEYDLYYVKHANLYLDALILLQTFRVMLGLKGQ